MNFLLGVGSLPRARILLSVPELCLLECVSIPSFTQNIALRNTHGNVAEPVYSEFSSARWGLRHRTILLILVSEAPVLIPKIRPATTSMTARWIVPFETFVISVSVVVGAFYRLD